MKKESNSRLVFTFRNSIANLAFVVITMAANAILQPILARKLGAEILGINGLFINIIAILNIAELGIGNAIVYSLYEPIAKKDKDRIKAILGFYKSAYRIIALFIPVAGLFLYPIALNLANYNGSTINVSAAYWIFIFTSSISYLFSYKGCFLTAQQKGYIPQVVNLGYRVITCFVQILILYKTNNYCIFLLANLITQLGANIFLTSIVNQKYPFLKEKPDRRLSKREKKNIAKKIKGLFSYRLSGAIIDGTDNLIIAGVTDIATVGLYSSYSMIAKAGNSLTRQLISASTASFGNILITENIDRIRILFKRIVIINFIIALSISSCFLLLVQPIISLWIGSDFLLSTTTAIIIAVNIFQTSLKQSFLMIKEASGVWDKDRYIPIFESIANIGFSLLLAVFFGLDGVILGTILSSCILWLYDFPKYVFCSILNLPKSLYFRTLSLFLLIYGASMAMSIILSSLTASNTPIYTLAIRLPVAILISVLSSLLILKKSGNYVYVKDNILSALHKFLNFKNSQK